MEKLKFNHSNAKYYSEDFIKGFECGVERQFEKDKAEQINIVRGKWEFDEKGYYCNKCGYRPFAGAYQFCAVCGADMRRMKESEEE